MSCGDPGGPASTAAADARRLEDLLGGISRAQWQAVRNELRITAASRSEYVAELGEQASAALPQLELCIHRTCDVTEGDDGNVELLASSAGGSKRFKTSSCDTADADVCVSLSLLGELFTSPWGGSLLCGYLTIRDASCMRAVSQPFCGSESTQVG